jgi:transcriptional regulator with XRE-family HTH domain
VTPARLREIRKRLGLSQSALAGVLGVSPQTVSNWETGSRPIGYPEMLRLALERLLLA